MPIAPVSLNERYLSSASRKVQEWRSTPGLKTAVLRLCPKAVVSSTGPACQHHHAGPIAPAERNSFQY